MLPKFPPLSVIPIIAFGQTVDLQAPDADYLRRDTIWRLRNIYELAMASWSLADRGVAIDVGAGFGGFAIPFARAYAGWTVWCFEPDPVSFSALQANIRDHKLDNVVAVNLAVADGKANAKIVAALRNRDFKTLRNICGKGHFRHHTKKVGYLEAGSGIVEDFESCRYPTLPAEALTALEPRFLKLIAPLSENAILDGLHDAPLDHIVGESWAHVPSGPVCDGEGLRNTWLPLAAAAPLALRNVSPPEGRRSGLDVVVAMYNASRWIVECVESLVGNDAEDIRALVVDDGSSDGCGDLVRRHFADNPRVIVHRKPNGGCASARNYGRLMSDATHITFVDADDVADRDLFPKLLELARYTGAEAVQGGFDFLHEGTDGKWTARPSYEDADAAFLAAPRLALGQDTMFFLPARRLMIGQPTIWRRVYRRDFLDSKKLWFPEHIHAFDDQIFQMLTLQYAGEVPAMDGVKLHYRQHPGQDIKQGDERGFASLEMFRTMLMRGLNDGWSDFEPLLRSYINTINWTHDGLREDLKAAFLKGAAELWVFMQKALDAPAFRDFPDAMFTAPDFSHHAGVTRAALEPFGNSYVWAHLDSTLMHVAMVKERHMCSHDTAIAAPREILIQRRKNEEKTVLPYRPAQDGHDLSAEQPGQEFSRSG